MTLSQHARLFIAASCLSLATFGTASLAGDMDRQFAVPFDSLVFNPLLGGPAEIAVVSGNPETGPSFVGLRFPPKFPGVMHTHTSGYHAVVLSGTSKHWLEDQDGANAPLQTAGDYWYQPGNQIHQDSFPSDEVTTVFLSFEGPIDFHVTE